MIVTLCGSTTFKDEMLQVAKEFTLKGHIVMLPLVYSHYGDYITNEQIVMLNSLHRTKIDMCDVVAIVCSSYIGEQTRNEIEYATQKGKTILYL